MNNKEELEKQAFEAKLDKLLDDIEVDLEDTYKMIKKGRRILYSLAFFLWAISTIAWIMWVFGFIFHPENTIIGRLLTSFAVGAGFATITFDNIKMIKRDRKFDKEHEEWREKFKKDRKKIEETRHPGTIPDKLVN